MKYKGLKRYKYGVGQVSDKSRKKSEREVQALILLTKFAEERGEKADTIRKYISRHKDDFEGHTCMKENKMLLDEQAIIILDEIYPLPRPIEFVEDTESRKQLLEAYESLNMAKDKIIELQSEIASNIQLIAQAEAQKLLLEDKEQQLNDERIKNKKMEDLLEEERQKILLLQEELAQEKNKSWWDKLRGK